MRASGQKLVKLCTHTHITAAKLVVRITDLCDILLCSSKSNFHLKTRIHTESNNGNVLVASSNKSHAILLLIFQKRKKG